MREFLRSARVFMLSLTLVSLANASLYTMQHQNSTVKVDTSQHAGMYSWKVDGVDQFYKDSQTTGTQWFWYRVGDQDQEQPLDNLTLADEFGTSRCVGIVYHDAAKNFDVEIDYTLNGGQAGSGVSHIIESISVFNYGQESLDFHFFQYTDLDIDATAGDDMAVHTNNNTIRQTDPYHYFNETVVTPVPNHWEITPYATTLNKLNDGVASTLSDTNSMVGPGDATWAFEWDVVIAPNGGTFQISKGKGIETAPEPATIALLALGGLSLLRRKK